MARVCGEWFDGEVTGVVSVVVVGAQTDQVFDIGGSAVGPVGDVVAFHVPGGAAAGVGAPAVAVFDQASGAGGHDALGASDVDG